MLDKVLLGVALLSLAGGLFSLAQKEPRWSRVVASLTTWFVYSNLYKTTILQSHLDSPVNLPAYAWGWQALTLASLVLLCQLLSRRHWCRLLYLCQSGLSILWLLDRLYERYFDDLPGLYLFTQISQAKAVMSSAIELLRWRDLPLVLDLLLAIPLLLLVAPRPPLRKKLLPWLTLPLFVSLYLVVTMESEDRRILRLRFRNVAAVQKLGMVHYHLYDGLQMVYSRWENLFDSSFDRETLRTQVQRSRQSIQADSPWKGRYRGKNLLIFQLESLEAFVLNLKIDGQEVTPFLNQLAHKSWVGGLQDQSGQGRSSDGEFILLNSLLPPGERPLVYAYPSNFYAGLPAILADQGYYTSYAVAYYGSFWNARYMARRYGFQKSLFREQLPNDPEHMIGWGMSDEGLLLRLQDYWDQFPQPFFAYTVTMMGHHPYRELLASQEQLLLPERLQDTMLGRYLQICRERDSEWERIVKLLKQKGLWQNSLVVLVGDHDARIPYEEMALLGPQKKFDEVDKIEHDRVFCLIHGPDGKLVGNSPPLAGQIDLAPTLLHLLGMTEVPVATLGQNLLVPLKRKAIVSKSGYALDSRSVSVDRGGRLESFSRSDHRSLSEPDLPSRQEFTRWYQLTRDILRLNLVKTMQGYSTESDERP